MRVPERQVGDGGRLRCPGPRTMLRGQWHGSAEIREVVAACLVGGAAISAVYKRGERMGADPIFVDYEYGDLREVIVGRGVMRYPDVKQAAWAAEGLKVLPELQSLQELVVFTQAWPQAFALIPWL